MEFLILGVILIVVSSSVYGPPIWRTARVYLYLRRRRQRICPETGSLASVQVDAIHAARTMITTGIAKLQVGDCTRWPARRGCEQSCLSGPALEVQEEIQNETIAPQLRRRGI